MTTVAWDLGEHAGTSPQVAYALEGSTFASGAAIQWLRDGLGVIEQAADVGPLAASVPDAGGVSVVPAFTGLGSPWWDPDARGHHHRPHPRQRRRAAGARRRRVPLVLGAGHGRRHGGGHR